MRTGLEPYLQIFGKASKNMVAWEQCYIYGQQMPVSDEEFNYQYNAGGYPTSCTVIDVLTHTRIHSFNFNYTATA